MRNRAAYIIISAVAAILHTLTAIAQPSGVVERLYIATDKQTYIAGERIWCSLYCLEAEGEGFLLSDFSSTAYLELQDQNQVVLTAKVALVEGRGAGAIELPPTLPTGNYKLLGYTTQNRNEAGFVPEGKILSIFNVITTERVEGNVELTREGLSVAVPAQSAAASPKGSISLELPQGEIKAGEEFYIELRNGAAADISLNLSVYHKNPFYTKTDSGIVNYWEKITHEPFGDVKMEFLPDYEGEVVRLDVKGASSDEMLYISFPGPQVDCYASNIDSAGVATIVTPNVYGERDMVCEGGSSMELRDPFIRKVDGAIPPLAIFPEMGEYLEQRGFSMQVGRRFDADTLYDRLPVRPNILLDANRVVYLLDDYTRFPKMEEVLVEFVNEVRIRSVKRQKQLSILINDQENSHYSTGYSLVMLDGVPVTDQAKILDYDPLLLHRIEIYTGIYSVGNVYYEGMANFITYKGDMSGFEFEDNVKILPYKGSLYPMAFTGASISEGGAYPDYRETIYWHPVLDLKGGDSLKIRCIAPLYGGDFDVVLEGVSLSGAPIYYKSTLKIR